MQTQHCQSRQPHQLHQPHPAQHPHQHRRPYHFIGIGGVGMSALARLLLQQGATVSGSDTSPNAATEALAKEGATIYAGHAATQVPQNSVVVYSSMISQENCEWQQARSQAAHILHRAVLLARLMQTKQALTVTGTHGKTTTSALLSHVLTQAGLDPSFAIGGFFQDTMCNGACGAGDFFVAEADESDGSFLQYPSFGAIVTNVDADHLPHFGNLKNIQSAFSQFMHQVQRPDLLFWCMDDAGLREMAEAESAQVSTQVPAQVPAGISYGWDAQAALRGMDYRQEGWNSIFSCTWQGKLYKDIKVALPGRHGALNSLAVFGMALALGCEEARIRAALASFPGVDRRFSIRGEVRSILVVDDYAHHPTEIRSALEAIAVATSGRRLVVLYQPHRHTRARDCMGCYQGKGIFDAADCVLITEIYGAGELPIEGISHRQIVQEVQEGFLGTVCEEVAPQELEDRLFDLLRPHDVVVCLGAGDITAFSKKLPEILERRAITKYQLALLCGGPSSEHSVSLLSMQQLLPQWNQELYQLHSFGITPKGEWITEEQVLRQLEQQGATPYRKLTEVIEANKAKGESTAMTRVAAKGTAMGTATAIKTPPRIPIGLLEQLLHCDMVVPILHGEWGEDGTVQGFCEVLGIPYVGCDVRSSAVCMDKSVVKALCLQHGIPAVPTVTILKRTWKEKGISLQDVAALGDFPFWVKPAHLGSSVCVERVFNIAQLEEALRAIFERDDTALVEQEMVGRELECAVLGNEEVHVFLPGEVLTEVLPYHYEGKYCSEATPTEAIATLSVHQVKEAVELSKRAYRLLGCKGLARVDLFLDAEDRCYLNEVNTLPGFTRNSLYPRMCVANGLPIRTLLDRLVILGLEAARMRRRQMLKKDSR